MMINWRNAERTHACYKHRAVERAEFEQYARELSEIVKNADEPKGEFHKQPGNKVQKTRKLVETAVQLFGGFCLLNGGVELFVNIVNAVFRVEFNFYDGFGGIGCHVLFYCHADDDLSVACVDPVSRDKAVDCGALGYGADVCGKQQVRIAEFVKPFFAFFANVFFRRGAFETVPEKIVCAVAAGHDVNSDAADGVKTAEPASVRTIAAGREGHVVGVKLCTDKNKDNSQCGAKQGDAAEEGRYSAFGLPEDVQKPALPKNDRSRCRKSNERNVSACGNSFCAFCARVDRKAVNEIKHTAKNDVGRKQNPAVEAESTGFEQEAGAVNQKCHAEKYGSAGCEKLLRAF